jgi:KDO2-lipid IV(A) lauroyltransferase
MLLWTLRLLALLPLWLLQAAGAAGGGLAFALSGGFRRKTVDNLRTAALYRPGLAWASAMAAGKAALETCYIWFRSDDVLLRGSRFDAFAGLARETEERTAAGDRRGVIVLTPHIGSFEVGARAYGSVAPITVLYKAPAARPFTTCSKWPARNHR